jgi:hypothetical protein
MIVFEHWIATMSPHFLSPKIAGTAVISQGKKGGGSLRIEKRPDASTSITLFSMKLGSFRSVILVSITPYGSITCAADSNVRYRRTIAPKGCHVSYQRRRQVFIKKSHTGFMLLSRDRVAFPESDIGVRLPITSWTIMPMP